jgi:hypothetical protein
MFARIGIMRALNRGHVREFAPRAKTIIGDAGSWVVGQFDCGRVPRWKMTGPGRILAGCHERNTNPC